MRDETLTMLEKANKLPNWQTLKLILSSLIVFNFYLASNPVVKVDYSILINLFDLVLIPMFVFIAAYTSKGISWQDWHTHLIPPLIIYVTFQTLDAIPLYYTGTLSIEKYLLFPQNGVWFFLAVPIWQAFFLLLPLGIKSKGIGLFITLLLSLFIAFWAVNSLLERTSFAAILQYFPFFVVAYFCDDKKLEWLRRHTFFVAPLMIILVGFYFYFQSEIESLLMQVFGHRLLICAFFMQIFSFLVGVLIAIVAICFALSTVRFVKIANNALGVYLIHPIICFLLLTGVGALNIETGLSILIALTLITIILALLLSTNPVIHWFLNPQIKSKK
ncbi:hypothetical protein GKR50_12720 [Providencia rustigianii]|nr:hypothetical protein [Providencia rustigianii]MTC60871.1 hypothetical protein [Providencia rustigianii]